MIEALTGGRRGPEDPFDAVVVFCGMKGESQPVPLQSSRDNPFQIGQTDTFNVRQYLKALIYIEDTHLFIFYAPRRNSGRHIKIAPSVRPSVCPSVTNRVSAITHKLLKQI